LASFYVLARETKVGRQKRCEKKYESVRFADHTDDPDPRKQNGADEGQAGQATIRSDEGFATGSSRDGPGCEPVERLPFVEPPDPDSSHLPFLARRNVRLYGFGCLG
jgi:hypothetical protein